MLFKKSQWLPIIIIAIINALFTYKYGIRFSSHPVIITIIYSMLLVSIPFISKIILPKKYTGLILNIIIALYCLADIYLLAATDPLKLNVDRWSVITSFWDYFFAGKYPYLAKSHMGNAPGPFPIYFLLALPFYFMHQIGYFSLLGLVLMLFYIFRQKVDITKKAAVIFMILISTSIIWELTTRSTILVNSCLILFYVWWLLNIKAFNIQKLIIAGIIGGLLLSTRGLAILPLIIIYSNLFLKERKWKEVLIIGSVLAITFALTLLPFALWDYRLFIQYNPFTLQEQHFLPGIVIAIVLLICLGLGLRIKNRFNIYLYSGSMLFLTVAAYFVSMVITEGSIAFMNSRIDISYFIFSMPFLFAALLEPVEIQKDAVLN